MMFLAFDVQNRWIASIETIRVEGKAGIRFLRWGARRICRATLTLSMICLIASMIRGSDQDQFKGGLEGERPVYFGTDVVPMLTKLGCNGGGCHGKATGQNGFRLSLFGFEPDFDYHAIVEESRGRRISPANPDASLLLTKATALVAHGGGRRLEPDSEDYRRLRRWIREGAKEPKETDPRLLRISLTFQEELLPKDATLPLKVMAHFSDGSSRDVTRQAVYQSNEPGVATVNDQGLVQTHSQSGLFSIMARFGDQIATFHAAVPFASEPASRQAIEDQLRKIQVEHRLDHHPIDRHLLAQWRKLGIMPSPEAEDATFLRRVTLDICGTLPTPEEVRDYIADKKEDKRQRWIDRLLERPEYASYFALKWADILQNRGAGYSTSQQRAGTTLFAGWIRDSFESNKRYDQFVGEILTASGSQREHPPTIWYRTVRKPTEYVESVAQAFLGVRVQCAQCHHHPTEQWSQADYFGLAAVFGRIGRKGGFADAEVPTDETIFVKTNGTVRHPRTGEVLPPRPLGETFPEGDDQEDPRAAFSRWLTHPSNPFFARTMVNRMWAHFLGRGIIHPIDDSRSTNPPSNPQLIDALAKDFVESGYDIKHLIRMITNSYAYRLESTPHVGNAREMQTYARFYPRRLAAEVLLDGMSQVLEIPTQFTNVPLGTRAIDLPDENVAAHFLDVFGRPSRMTACECERVDAPALTQALELVNSAELHRKLTDPKGFAARIAKSEKPLAESIDQVFLQVLSRHPRPEELETACRLLEGSMDRDEAIRSLLWSLLATNEFLFNH